MEQDDPPRNLVTIKYFSEVTGMTEKSIRSRISDGKWLKGKHYFTRGRRNYIDFNAVMEWIKGEV